MTSPVESLGNEGSNVEALDNSVKHFGLCLCSFSNCMSLTTEVVIIPRRCSFSLSALPSQGSASSSHLVDDPPRVPLSSDIINKKGITT